MTVLLGIFCLTLYFIPVILAWGKQNFASIFVVNFFLGWTIIGWVVALAWAVKPEPSVVGR